MDGWMVPKSAMRMPGTAHWRLLEVFAPGKDQQWATFSQKRWESAKVPTPQTMGNRKFLLFVSQITIFFTTDITVSAPCFPSLANKDFVLGFVVSFPPLQK